MTKVKRSAFTFVIRFNASVPLELVVFFENEDYRRLIDEKYTCYERAAYARSKGNVFRLSRYLSPDEKNDGWVTAKESLGFTGKRPRWYYFFIMNCNPLPCTHPYGWCQGPIDVEYKLLMTNGVGYMKHFSADEVGILPTAITFGICYLLLTLFAFTCIMRPLQTQRKLHWTVIMYMVALIMYSISMWFDTADLAEEGSYGTRCETCQMIAITLRIFSDSITLLTAIVLAKGWTVVRRKISAKGRVKIAIFMTTYMIAGIFSLNGQFTQSGDFLFRTPTDRLLDWGWYQFVARIFAFVWFTYALFTTTKYDSFRKFSCFFKTLYCTIGLWIMTLPFSMLIALAMESYYRARWMYAMEIGSALIGHVAFSYLFHPSRHNQSFPFAFRTAAMEAQDRWSESKTLATSENRETKNSTRLSRLPRDSTPTIQNESTVEETHFGLTSRNSVTNTHIQNKVRRRSAISGGMELDAPLVRVRGLASSLRKKLGVVFEVADHLEEELNNLDDEEDENGALLNLKEVDKNNNSDS
jgi:hypothetical protein